MDVLQAGSLARVGRSVVGCRPKAAERSRVSSRMSASDRMLC